MHPGHAARIVAFPTAPSVSEVAIATPRQTECRVVTGISLTGGDLQRSQLTESCQQVAKLFRKKWGFPLPILVFEQDSDLAADEWCLTIRGNEVHQGKLGLEPLESISQELLSRPWKLLTYESFRIRLKELEDSEPYLIQEVLSRLDLVLSWQIFQMTLKNGGSLHRFSSKLERLLIESASCSREQLLSPRVLSALQQI